VKIGRWIATVVLLTILSGATYFRISYDSYLERTREGMARCAIVSLQIAETKYKVDSGSFATSLDQLGPPANGIVGASAPNLISKSLAEGRSWGYRITLAPSPTGFSIQAVPDGSQHNPGRYSFYSDETLVIRREIAPPLATSASPQLR